MTAIIAIRNKDRLVIADTVVDESDFEWLNQWRWCLLSKGYVGRSENDGPVSRTIRMHRQILGLERGDERQGDHINGEVLDNRRANLRIVTRSGNSQNKRSHNGSSSQYRGVALMKNGKWRANVRVNGELFYLGEYRDEREAAKIAADFRKRHLPFSVAERNPV